MDFCIKSREIKTMILLNKLFFRYLLFAILLLFSISSIAQKKNKDMYSYVTCFFDSMNKKGIDTILIGSYSSDYGVNTHIQQFFFWKEKGKGRLLIFKGTEDDFSIKNIYDNALEMDLTFFRNHRLDTMHSAIKTTGWQSHDYDWVISIKTKNNTSTIRVLDWKQKDNPTDIRCMWVKSIENKMKKYW